MHFATLGDCANESQASGGWCWRDCSPDHDPEGGHCKRVDAQESEHKRVGTVRAHRHSQHRSRHLWSDQQSQRQPQRGVTSLPAGQHEALCDLDLGGSHHLSHGRSAPVLHPQNLPGGSNHLLVFKYTLTSMTNEL